MKFTPLAAGMLAAGLLVAACGDDDEESTSTTAAGEAATTAGEGAGGEAVDCQPVEDGVLTVVTSLPGPNFWGTTAAEVDPDDISSGIEYDLANLIAERCGLEMNFRNEGFDTIVAGQVDPDSFDIALSQVTITDERAEVVDFSVGYFKSDQGLLVPAGTEVTSWDDVASMTVGVQASSTAEHYTMSGEVPGWQLPDVKSYPDLATAFSALNAGQVDAVMVDTPINLGQAAQSDGELEVVAQFQTGEEYGAIFGLGNGKKAIFDPILQELIDDGTVNELIAEYLGGDPSTVPFVDVPTS
jgi:polar amino acid transport system substrate-binding protein